MRMHWSKVSTCLSLLLFWSLSVYSVSVLDEISLRLDKLRTVASSARRHKPCNESRLVVITEFPWGNAGNQLISFTHGLYMAQLTDATFIVPHYMSSILHPFNLTLIRSLYCFKEEWDYEGKIEPTKPKIFCIICCGGPQRKCGFSSSMHSLEHYSYTITLHALLQIPKSHKRLSY